MKTFIILMLVSSQAIGQVYYSLEGGVLNNKLSINDNYFFAEYNPNKFMMYTDIKLGYHYKNIHSEFNLINVFDKGKSVYFSPKVIKYDFRIYYKYDKIKIGYEHSCTHPIYNEIRTLNKSLYRNSYDKFFIRYEFYQ